MRNTLTWIVALGSSLFILLMLCYITPTFIYIVLSGLAAVALVCLLLLCLVAGLSKWRKVSKFWLMPTLLCLAFITCSSYIASSVARRISDFMFDKHLGDYTKVVGDFKNGRLLCVRSCYGNFEDISGASLPTGVAHIWGTHCNGGEVVVLFLRQTDMRVHEGYMFRRYKETGSCNRQVSSGNFKWFDLPYERNINGDWYRVSDQPGF